MSDPSAKNRAVLAMQVLTRLAWETERTDTTPRRRRDAVRRIDAALQVLLGNTPDTLAWVAVAARVLDAGAAVRGGANIDQMADAVRRADPDLHAVSVQLVREAVQDAARSRPAWKSMLALMQAAGLAEGFETADSLRARWAKVKKQGVPEPYQP